MARVAPAVPEDSALLCEKCGYIINGLPTDSRCPECATPISESSPELRRPPLWEEKTWSSGHRFWATTAQVIFTPSRFFRSMTPRGDSDRSESFARWHMILCSIIFGATAYAHAIWAWPGLWVYRPISSPAIFAVFTSLLLGLGAYLLLTLVTAIAARLTAWEAAYRGLRLPHRVVERVLDYHSAHYLPVALSAFTVVVGYQFLIHTSPSMEKFGVPYLYVLCAEVILAAAYLFITYWKGMRNLMYANGPTG